MFELFDLPKIFLPERFVKAREQIDLQYQCECLYLYYIPIKYLYLYWKLWWYKNNILLAILRAAEFLFENDYASFHI